MRDVTPIREKINEMAALSLSMLESAFAGFMKNDPDALDCVLKAKQKLSDKEKEVTASLAALSQTKIDDAQKKDIMLLLAIAADLEEVGDCIEAMIERIEIKIEEKLIFSDDSMDEYSHLYHAVETELEDVEKALHKNDKNFARRILSSAENQVDNLVGQYRQSHTRRIVAGICLPRTCNMFLDLLDLTGQLSRHTKAIARSILDLR